MTVTFEWPKKMFKKIFGENVFWLMEDTHLLGPHKSFQRHSIHMRGENELKPGGPL